jgi:uncharacterized protein YcnI
MTSVPRATPVHSRRRWSARAAVSACGAAALVLAAAGGAFAHVTVHSADAKPGGTDATVVFKVPNEESNAKTTKIEIDLPTDSTALSGVTATAPSGWKADVNATQIVFSGGTISGDDDQEFPIKVAKLPTADKIVFKALQTYSNGDVVRWIEQAPDGAPEPAHPAPTLDLQNPSKLSEDEIADAKEEAEKDAKAGSSDSKSGDLAGMGMSTMSAADMAAMPGMSASATASPSSSPSASSSPSPTSSSSSAPMSVHAGTGGQAAGGHGMPVAPTPFVLAGLAAAAYGVRRLVRG